ncbi:stage II sporulation protein R [Halobacillus halophilus]|uniref:stage II sporulation protein R n=1 Tax=Halobacillus halophilus TaxID=1570 RepID=UPI00136E304B|nr:stage II sporulation protein R [Halobacillus halophilus]MYL29356.1 stage II sporulation protein R [Halobacillus halophilus]
MKNSGWLLLSLIILITVLPWGQKSEADIDYQVIPDEAIRLRILADSNNGEDQRIKRKVRDQVNGEITKWVQDLTSVEAARQLIESRLPELEAIVQETLEAEGKRYSYTVAYGENVQFPTKLYGSYIYPAGEYEAVLITLGEGDGDNWWCVLFPPLCFLDFSNGTSVAESEEEPSEKVEEDKEEKEVKFFVVEIWENLFS